MRYKVTITRPSNERKLFTGDSHINLRGGLLHISTDWVMEEAALGHHRELYTEVKAACLHYFN